jgi:hypothetical protein
MYIIKTVDSQIYVEKLNSGSYELTFDIPCVIESLEEISERMGKLNERSFMDGNRNVSGLLGEYLFFQLFRTKVKYVGNNIFDYDFVSESEKTYDVKTKTQGVDVDPIIGKSEPFDASIPLYSQGMKCDDYVFLRVHKNFHKAWLLGWIEKENYFSHEQIKILKKGKTDGWNKMMVKCNSANLKYQYLNRFNLTNKHFKNINSSDSIQKSNDYIQILKNAN